MRGSSNLSGMERERGQATQAGAALFTPSLACLLAPLSASPLPGACVVPITDILAIKHRKLWKSSM